MKVVGLLLCSPLMSLKVWYRGTINLVANSKCCPVNVLLNSCCRALVSRDIVETSVSQEMATTEFVGVRRPVDLSVELVEWLSSQP